MLRRLVVVLAIAVLAVGLPASADTGSLTDKKGDATGCLDGPKPSCDIVKASWGHASNGRLVHSVSVAGTIGAPNGSGPQPFPRLMIDVPGQKFDNPTCDYFIQTLPPGAGPNTSDHYKFYVETCQNSGAQVKGPAAVSRPDAHSIKLVFSRKLIGSPSRYGWRWESPGDGDNPPYDAAPNKGYKAHVL